MCSHVAPNKKGLIILIPNAKMFKASFEITLSVFDNFNFCSGLLDIYHLYFQKNRPTYETHCFPGFWSELCLWSSHTKVNVNFSKAEFIGNIF